MRVLIVSFPFPPANVVGAIRVGKLARYLNGRGHEACVLTTEIGGDRSVPVEIPTEQVIYTDYRQRSDRLAVLGRPFRRSLGAAVGGCKWRSASSRGQATEQAGLGLGATPIPRFDPYPRHAQ